MISAPPTRASVVIFACVDDVRSWFKREAAQRAIHSLASRDVPVVFVSTGPAQDILVVQESLGLRQPFICGGGALVYVPAEYFGDLGTVGVRRDTWRVVEFGGRHDPGPAIGLLVSLYRMSNRDVVVVGLGRERADAVVLQQVEVPIVVRHDSIDQIQLDAGLTPPFLAEEPAINSYMLNVIGAAPLMAGGQFQPYASAGAGWFTLSADPTPGDSSIELDTTETGWNAGFGLMGFLGQLGVRADLRYFGVTGDEFAGVDGSVLRARHGVVVDDQEQRLDVGMISGASFWRGNVGVALRW